MKGDVKKVPEENRSPSEKKSRRRPLVLGGLILAVLLVAGLGLGTWWFLDQYNYVSTDDAAIDGDRVNISAKMLGRIKDILVAEGDSVQAGQLLVLLDDADLRAQETQAAASLNYARQSQVLANVNLDKTQDDFQRAKALFNSGATTKEQYVHAAKALETANAQYAIAQAQVDTAKAQLGVIETQLLNTRISTPISGVIAKKTLMIGDVVQPAQTIFTINDLQSIWVTANFEETKIRRIRVGAEVQISVDAHPKYPLRGRVVRIGAGILPPPFSIGEFTKTTQRIPIRIAFADIPQSLLLLPGMSVEVKVKTK
jgi:membrane fusion protein (multidrug efflux system)